MRRGLRNIDYQDNLLMLIKQKIHVLPQFLNSRQTDPDPEDCSADSDVAAQRSEDDEGRELQPGPGESHLLAEYDLCQVVRVWLSLHQLALVLVINTVLQTLHCIAYIYTIFATFVHSLAAHKFSIFLTKIANSFVLFGLSGDPSQW